MRYALGVMAAALAVGLVTIHWAAADPKVYVNRPAAAGPAPSLADIDHAVYDRLLQQYVDDHGLVAYAEWKKNQADVAALDGYLAALAAADPGKPASKNAQLAFWINAYNAVTIRGILREYPTSSIRNHASKEGYNIWKDLMLWVARRPYSLDDIEHAILRRMAEPRIHFAVNCASLGCPPLVKRAFTADNLDRLLDWNARRFFADPRNLRVDPRTRTVHVSSLLDWYGKDFAAAPQAQVRLLRRYFPAPDTLGWLDREFIVHYLPYDWNLNEQRR